MLPRLFCTVLQTSPAIIVDTNN